MVSRNSSFEETECMDQITLKTVCPFCGKKQQLILTGDRVVAYKQGKIAYEAGYHMRDAFSSFTPDEREFMMTGICPECWDNM